MRQQELWLHEVLAQQEREALALALVKFEVSYQTCRGGKATVTSKQKKTIIRARWKGVPVEKAVSTEAGRRALEWLLANNATYSAFVQSTTMCWKSGPQRAHCGFQPPSFCCRCPAWRSRRGRGCTPSRPVATPISPAD